VTAPRRPAEKAIDALRRVIFGLLCMDLPPVRPNA